MQQIKRESASLDAVIATNQLACRLASSLGGIESSRIHYAPYGVRLPEVFGIYTEQNAQSNAYRLRQSIR